MDKCSWSHSREKACVSSRCNTHQYTVLIEVLFTLLPTTTSMRQGDLCSHCLVYLCMLRLIAPDLRCSWRRSATALRTCCALSRHALPSAGQDAIEAAVSSRC